MKVLVAAAACALLVTHHPVDAQVSWKRPHLSPPSHELECAQNTHIVDRQTRQEIEARLGGSAKAKKTGNLTDFMNEVARRISGMESAGYRTSGNGTVFTLNLPMRIIYSRPIEFRARADDDGVTLGVVRRDGRYKVAVDKDAMRYMKPENSAQIDVKRKAFVRQMDEQAQRIRDNLNEKPFKWDDSEQRRLRRGGHGSFVRITSYGFCGQSYRVAMTAAWSAPAPKPTK